MTKNRPGHPQETNKKWYLFWRRSRPPKEENFTLPDYTIRVSPTDLYDLSTNLIDLVAMDEPEVILALTEEETKSDPRERKRSRFLETLRDEIHAFSERLSTVGDKVEDVEKAEKYIEQSLIEIKHDLESLRHKREKDAAGLAEKRLVEEITRRVDSLSHEFAAAEKVDKLALEMDRDRSSFARRSIMEEIALAVEEIRKDYVGKDKVQDIERSLQSLSETAAGPGAIEELASEIESVKRGSAPAARLEELAARVESLAESSAGAEALSRIEEELERVKSEAAANEALAELADRVRAIGSDYADLESVEKLSARIEELRSRYTGRGLLDKVYDHVETLGSRFANRLQVEDILDRVLMIAETYADREILEFVAGQVEYIRNAYAERSALEEVAAEVAGIAESYARARDLSRLAEDVETLSDRSALASDLEGLGQKVEAIEAEYASRGKLRELAELVGSIESDYASVSGLEKLSEAVEEINSSYATSGDLAETRTRLAAVEELYARSEALDKVSEKLARLADVAAEKDGLAEAVGRLEKIESSYAREIKVQELEESLEALAEKAADDSELQEVIGKLGDLASTAAAGTDLEKAVGRLERIEERYADSDEVAELSALLKKLSGDAARQKDLIEVEARVGELEKTRAGAEELAELSDKVERIEAEAARAEETAAAIEGLEALAGSKASSEDLAALAEEVGSLNKSSARAEAVERLREDIARLAEGSAAREDLERVSGRLEELGKNGATRRQVSEIEERLGELTSEVERLDLLVNVPVKPGEDRSADAEALEAFSEKLSEIQSRFVSMDDLDAMAEIIEEARGEAADKNSLEKLSRRLDKTVSDLAGLADLEKKLADLSGSFARQEDADKTRLELIEIRGLIGELSEAFEEREEQRRKLGEVEKDKRSEVSEVKLERIEKRIGEVQDKAASSDDLARLSDLVGEMSGRLDKDERSRRKMAERIDRVSSDSAREARDRLDDYSTRLLALEGRLEGMEDKIEAETAPSDLEKRLVHIEDEMARLASTLEAGQAGGGDPDSAKTREALVKAFERLASVEDEHKELKRQIRKAFENLTAYPLADLEGLKTKIANLESWRREAEKENRQDSFDVEIEGLKAKLEAVEKGQAVTEKRFETASAPLADLESVKKKLKMVEETQKRLHRPPPPGRTQTRSAREGSLTWARFMLIMIPAFLVATAVGTVAAVWWSDGRQDETEEVAMLSGGSAFSPLDQPNIIYDAIEPLLQTPTLDVASESLALSDGKVNITGYAPGADVAYLMLNNEEVAATDVVDQGFSFDEVHLAYGVNVVEVKVTDGQGNEANSMASMIERESLRMARVRHSSAVNRMRGPRDLPYLALTIDAGASKKRAEEILDVLHEKGIITTFFLTGQFIERYPEVARRIVAEGHEVGNHTYSHPHLTTFEKNRRHNTSSGVTRENLREELLKTKDLFEAATGAEMIHWWRAPYGEHNPTILAWAAEAGFKHVDWTRTPVNHDMLDWVADERSRYYLNGDKLYKRFMSIDGGVAGRANGGIILMHLGSDRRKDFIDEILPKAIDDLRQRDYQFVTISRMFSR